ncbi:MAG: hypothetical protein ACREPM_16550 [Gemmatimonadaceae bacterium]
MHRRSERGWIVTGAAANVIELAGRLGAATGASTDGIHQTAELVLASGETRTIELGRLHYRRSEQSWADAGSPTASIAFRATRDALHVAILVPKSEWTFAPSAAENRYDNEHADVNGDGVQLHLRTAEGAAHWMLVPEVATNNVRVRPIGGTAKSSPPRASWRTVDTGYRMDVDITPVPVALDVIVNEMPAGRERRRGQLVLSGADGEFVYLRGDRHDLSRLISVRVVDD